MNNFPLKIKVIDKLGDFGIIKSYKFLRDFERLATLDQDKYIETHLKNIIILAASHSEYYKHRWSIDYSKLDKNNFHKFIPITVKDELRSNNESNITDNIKIYRTYSTGGSTGKPLTYPVSKNHFSLHGAALLRSYSWGGWKPADSVLTVGGSSLSYKKESIKNNLILKARSWIEDSKIFPSFKLNRENAKSIFNILSKNKIDFLRGYPSSLLQLSDYYEDMKSRYDIKIKGIFMTAEMLTSKERKLVQDRFEVTVFDHFGSRDGGAHASECSEGNKHLMTSLAFWEVVDDEGEQVSPGEIGRLLLTDLHNQSFPFIRYENGDLITAPDLSDLCSCGINLPITKKIVGRKHDVIRTPEGGTVYGELFTYIIRYEFNIEAFQVKQVKIDHILINIIEKSNNPIDKKRLIEYLIPSLGKDMIIEINSVDELEYPESGKRRWIIGLDQ